ncbi:MAG: hypothetical protein ACT4PE_10315 [Candidatus Eiseniibacteriota bacterium]
MRRSLPVALLGVAAAASGAAHAVPDLAVRRDGFALHGDSLAIVVENLGDDASPPTEILVSDRPLLGGPTGTSSHYRPLCGVEGLWVDQEPSGADAVALTVHLGSGPDTTRGRGRIELSGTQGMTLDPAPEGVRVESGGTAASWDLDVPTRGTAFTLRVPVMRGRPPTAQVFVVPEGRRLALEVSTSTGDTRGSATLVLDCLERPMASRQRVPLAALAAGARDTVSVAFGGGDPGEAVVWVDPDDALEEAREGNNVAAWHTDRERWTLAGLHVHSCFSEGSGSFDWQAWHAALSGYDLVWWSEHDWRVTCRDHLQSIGFEASEAVTADLAGRGTDCAAELQGNEVAGGERALRLVTGADGGQARARLEAERKRFTYALASGVAVELRVLARSLDPGDVLTVGFELSRHPGEARSLEYAVRWEGTPPAENDAKDWAPVVPMTVPTGGWVTLRLAVTKDAEAAWANGADANLIGIWLDLRAAGSAEVFVDDLAFTHRRCGVELIRVQQEWTELYPNLRHEIGGEISYSRPHLTRYGGDWSLVMRDFERAAAADSVTALGDAEELVEVVHRASGLVSWCHPLGATMFSGLGPDQFQAAIDAGLAGVDALEVGYRRRAKWNLADYFDVWDRATAGGIVVTALGVNDSHYNQWAPWENNFATWLEAPADDRDALLRALREGRAFFGDPVSFRGRVQLDVGGTPMGGMVGGSGPRTARIRLAGIGEDRTVKLVVDGRVRREWTGVSGDAVLTEGMSAGEARAARAEVWSADDQPLAFTNPVYFGREGSRARGSE